MAIFPVRVQHAHLKFEHRVAHRDKRSPRTVHLLDSDQALFRRIKPWHLRLHLSWRNAKLVCNILQRSDCPSAPVLLNSCAVGHEGNRQCPHLPVLAVLHFTSPFAKSCSCRSLVRSFGSQRPHTLARFRLAVVVSPASVIRAAAGIASPCGLSEPLTCPLRLSDTRDPQDGFGFIVEFHW